MATGPARRLSPSAGGAAAVLLLLALLPAPTQSQSGDVGPAVVGGQAAPRGRFTYQLGVLPSGCGGSLIREDVALTAAHCMPKRPVAAKISIVAGSYIDFYTNRSEGQTVAAHKVGVHPDYNTLVSQSGDLALIFLKSCVTMNSRTSVIQLASPAEAAAAQGATMTVTGWGTSSAGSNSLGMRGAYPGVLNVGLARYISPAACALVYPKTGWTAWYYDPATMICAGNVTSTLPYGPPFQDGCAGDSGGPLAFSTTNPQAPLSGAAQDDRLVGITSWAIGCGLPGQAGIPVDVTPGVYISTLAYAGWIGAQLDANKSPCSTATTLTYVSVDPAANFAALPSRTLRLAAGQGLAACQAACAASVTAGTGCVAISLGTKGLATYCSIYYAMVPAHTCVPSSKVPPCDQASQGSYRVKWV